MAYPAASTAASSSTSAPPFHIPIHFASGLTPASGPTLPKQWRHRWHATEIVESKHNGSSGATGLQVEDSEEDVWPDVYLDRWITSMTAWEVEGQPSEEEEEDNGTGGLKTEDEAQSSTAPGISILDEHGGPIAADAKESRRRVTLGHRKGGRRIAVGTQDGTVWIFQEQWRPRLPKLTPARSRVSSFDSRFRSPSRTSLSALLPSPARINGADSSLAELEGVTSPTTASVGMSDINASAEALRISSNMDAEEQLEIQWHAGREKPSRMGGVMEVLGLQHPDHSHEHVHSHNGNPAVKRYSRTSVERKGQPAPGAAERQAAANGTGGSEISSSLAEAGLMGAIGLAGGRKYAGGAGVQGEASRHRNTGSGSFATAEQLPEAVPTPERVCSARPLTDVVPLLSLQCPESRPISSLAISQTRNGEEVLCILQDDGRLTLRSFSETLNVQSIDLKTAKPVSLESEAVQFSNSPGAFGASPFARIAAMRSQVGTPVAPRSRSHSNASSHPPTDPITLPGRSRFFALHPRQLPNGAAKNLFVCYDSTQKLLHVVDCARSLVVAQHRIEDIGTLLPSAQFSPNAESLEVYYINTSSTVIFHSFAVRAKPKTQAEPEIRANPFNTAAAFLRREGVSQGVSRASSRPASIAAAEKNSRLELGEIVSKGEHELKGLLLLYDGQMVAWSSRKVFLAKRIGDSLIVQDTLEQACPIEAVSSLDRYIEVRFRKDILLLSISPSGNLGVRFTTAGADEIDASFSSNDICNAPLICRRTSDDRLVLYSGQKLIWQGVQHFDESSQRITASLPFNMERIVLSSASGRLISCSLGDLIASKIKWPDESDEDGGEPTRTVNLLQLIIHPKTKQRLIFGGSEEGDVIVWDAQTLELQADHTFLNSPVVGFVSIGDQDNALRLHGCVACVSADGTIALVDLNGFELVFLVAGRDAPLEMMAVRSNDLMVIYGDGRARVWNVAKGELRTSISVDQASALLDDGKGWWSKYKIGAEQLKREKGSAGVLSSVPTSRDHLAGTMTANVRRLIEASSKMVAISIAGGVNGAADSEVEAKALQGERSVSKAETVVSLDLPQARKALHTLRPLLSCLLPPCGMDEDIDHLTQQVFGTNEVESSKISVGIFDEPGHLAMSLHDANQGAQSLSVSTALTTTRLVASIAMLLVLSNIAELHDSSQQLIAVLGSLHTRLGSTYQQPSMSALIAFLTDPILEIKQAAQTLFVSSLQSMSQAELDVICAEYGPSLPSQRRSARQDQNEDHEATDTTGEGVEKTDRLEEDDGEDFNASKALLLLGLIATQRYTDLAPVLLKDIATSISIFLNEEDNPAHQSVAITLCDRGFSIFQHYFDAMEIVRTLFALSTMIQEGSRHKTDPTGAPDKIYTPLAFENRDLARQAVLRISEENTPLFMTTLSLDILHARSPEHCSATMRLVALMVRRKPLVLYPNLPRLAEAVVKSLDPTITALRTVVHRSATIIISELIATYPTIAFHKGLQRLAVATFEGAVIMYDLKTATRLYVLEAHSTMLNGLLFSEDGRRLISICLGDGMVKVWKTGVGLGSLFNFGNAPRQMSALLGRAAAFVAPPEEGIETNQGADSAGATTGTPPYKSFDFGRMAATALASVRRNSQSQALHSPRAASSAQSHHDDAMMTDLNLVRLTWQAERSVHVRIGEANLVFDVA